MHLKHVGGLEKVPKENDPSILKAKKRSELWVCGKAHYIFKRLLVVQGG